MSAPTDLSPQAIASLVEALARFSAPGPGVTRFVYDEAWCDAQEWMRAEARTRGLAATPDAAGNLYLHDGELGAGPVFYTGSHLDTVAMGGPLDGAYGALAGLLLAAALRGETTPPVVGLVTCEEEGSRFPGAFLGAKALLGRVKPGEPDAAKDANGISWRAALERAAARGCASPGGCETGATALRPASAFLELHIEQGPVLEADGLQIGIVDRIAGYRRLRVTLTGEARHAGTTPMRLRRDALAAAAEMALAAERLAIEQGEPAVATAGAASASPGLYNVVAGSCELRLDVRHVEPLALDALAGAIEAECRAIAARRRVELALETVSRQDPIPMDARFVAEAEALAARRGLRARRMASGAGHDAMIFASAGVPSLMLFVPSRGGISHAPEEFTAPEALALGIDFARELLPRIAARLGGSE
jgi:allantoate deiminase